MGMRHDSDEYPLWLSVALSLGTVAAMAVGYNLGQYIKEVIFK